MSIWAEESDDHCCIGNHVEFLNAKCIGVLTHRLHSLFSDLSRSLILFFARKIVALRTKKNPKNDAIDLYILPRQRTSPVVFRAACRKQQLGRLVVLEKGEFRRVCSIPLWAHFPPIEIVSGDRNSASLF